MKVLLLCLLSFLLLPLPFMQFSCKKYVLFALPLGPLMANKVAERSNICKLTQFQLTSVKAFSIGGILHFETKALE